MMLLSTSAIHFVVNQFIRPVRLNLISNHAPFLVVIAYGGNAMRERVIRDEIHKDILVPPNHADYRYKEFQRLRSIQQLSTCEYVFPAANHNRFSHS